MSISSTMTNCTKEHKLKITNLQNQEHLTYSTVLIQGILDSICKNATTVTIINKTNEKAYEFPVSLTDKLFKCIVDLTEGENCLTIKYCNSIETLHLTLCSLQDQIHSLRLLYIVCDGHNGCFQSPKNLDNNMKSACNRIDTGARLIQCLIAEKLNERGFGRRTFQLTNEHCEPFHSKLTVNEARNMGQLELWNYFAREIIGRFPSDNNLIKYCAFIGCTKFKGITDGDYSYENIKRHTLANASLGGGDLALFGTGCLYTWPTRTDEVIDYFKNTELIDRKEYMDDSNSRGTFGGCFATTLGAVCHEICHTFDLGHTETGIMGNGFDFVNRVFTVDNLTEMLPNRMPNSQNFLGNISTNKRFTNIKKENKFLLEYQCQKNNDLTYFAENSAIALAHHCWIRPSMEIRQNEIILDLKRKMIQSELSALLLIELRDLISNIALKWYSFLDKSIYHFEIPNFTYEDAYEIFVMDYDGNIKRFNVEKSI